MICEKIVVGALETNCYLVYCEDTLECVVVDPGAEAEKIIQAVVVKQLKPIFLINTHGHIDHIGANKDIKDLYDIPLYIHISDAPMLQSSLQNEMASFLRAKTSPSPDYYLHEGEPLSFGKIKLEVLHTPGHSPGGVCLVGDTFILSGDTLFCGGVGRTDLPGGDWKELEQSIKTKIFTLPEETVVFPGHGPSSSVKQEKNANPYLR